MRAVITSRQQKHYSSAARKLPDPVDLAFDVIEPKEVTVPDQSFVICHGLFGSKQNWRSLGKAFAQKLGMTVYTLVCWCWHGGASCRPSVLQADNYSRVSPCSSSARRLLDAFVTHLPPPHHRAHPHI